jgi:hypothetical protein
MKNLFLLSVLSFGTLLAAQSSFAKGYGEAGCGLGSIVFGDDPSKASQVMAATTNGTSVTDMFGITSGTSNCTDDGAVRGAQAVPMFIEVNKLSLAKDAARGSGETLAGLANLMGCDSSTLGQAMKKDYQAIFFDSKMDAQLIHSKINLAVTNHQACGA